MVWYDICSWGTPVYSVTSPKFRTIILSNLDISSPLWRTASYILARNALIYSLKPPVSTVSSFPVLVLNPYNRYRYSSLLVPSLRLKPYTSATSEVFIACDTLVDAWSCLDLVSSIDVARHQRRIERLWAMVSNNSSAAMNRKARKRQFRDRERRDKRVCPSSGSDQV